MITALNNERAFDKSFNLVTTLIQTLKARQKSTTFSCENIMVALDVP